MATKTPTSPNTGATTMLDAELIQAEETVIQLPELQNSAPGSEQKREIAFIDPGVDDLQTLLEGMRPDVEPILLNDHEPAPGQMARAVQGRDGLEAIHVIAHGRRGRVSVGPHGLSRGISTNASRNWFHLEAEPGDLSAQPRSACPAAYVAIEPHVAHAPDSDDALGTLQQITQRKTSLRLRGADLPLTSPEVPFKHHQH